MYFFRKFFSKNSSSNGFRYNRLIVPSMFVLVLMSCPALLLANIPDYIPVNGLLTSLSGEPLTGSHEMAFALYTSEMDIVPIWSEAYLDGEAITVDDGVFNAYLGTITPLNFSLLALSEALWLGITVDGEEMGRLRLGSVPFAVEAHHCQQVTDTQCQADQYLQGWDPKTREPVCKSISFEDLTDIPAGVEDGDDDTTYQFSAETGLQIDENNVVSLNEPLIREWASEACWDTPPPIDADTLNGETSDAFAQADHSHMVRTILVSPAGSGLDANANGNVLEAAMESIVDANELSPVLLKIEPGVYEIREDDGTHKSLNMKPWVSIEGSGADNTVITGSGFTGEGLSGTINAAENVEIRALKVVNTGSASDTHAIAIYARDGDLKLKNIVAESTSKRAYAVELYNVGDRQNGTYAEIHHSRISTKGSDSAFGIQCNNCLLKVSNTSFLGVLDSDGFGSCILLDDSIASFNTITAEISSTDSGAIIQPIETINGSDIRIMNSRFNCTGILCSGIKNDASNFLVMSSLLDVTGDENNSYGVTNFVNHTQSTQQTYRMEIIGSHIHSTGPTLNTSTNLFDISIGNSTIAGGAMINPDGSRIKCAFVQDENFDSYLGDCPL